MDDQDMALNPEVETETAQTTTPVENETTESTETAEASTEELTQESPKKGANSRIRELNHEVKSLRERVAELTSPVGQPGQYPQYQPLPTDEPFVKPGEELTYEELNRRQAEREQRLRQEFLQTSGVAAQRAITIDRINRESEEVTAKYPELDPESDSFDKDLSDTIYEAVEAKVKADPNASVKQFVAKQMALYKRGVSKEEKQTQAVVSKQAAQSAIRPSQNKPVERQFNELSIAEMEARLGFAS